MACANAVLARDEVKSAFWEGERLVVVEGIPALVCQSCGEQYYEDDTAMKLDLMRGSGFSVQNAVRSLTVPVFVFEAPGPDRNAEKDDAQA
jgi:YgiT-type zinc finger domain-containing protein